MYRRYAGVPYPNADDRALSMAASSSMTAGARLRAFRGSKASRFVTHFCNRSMRRRFYPTVRIGDLGLGGGTERWAEAEGPNAQNGGMLLHARWLCRFGGTRAYFICPGPEDGTDCGRRISKLYL